MRTCSIYRNVVPNSMFIALVSLLLLFLRVFLELSVVLVVGM